MVQAAPTWRAASAVACAWFPEEYATTAFGLSSEKTRFDAPRILNAPPVCRFSHLKKVRTPDAESNDREVSTGVRCAMGRMRTAASRIMEIVTSVCTFSIVAVSSSVLSWTCPHF